MQRKVCAEKQYLRFLRFWRHLCFSSIYLHTAQRKVHMAQYIQYSCMKSRQHISLSWWCIYTYCCLCCLQSFDLVYVLVFASLSSPLSADEVGAVPLQSGRGHVSAAWHVREPGNHPWIGFTGNVEPIFRRIFLMPSTSANRGTTNTTIPLF